MENIMRQLIDELHTLTKAYNQGNPIVSDKEWDEKYFQLQELEKNTGFIYPDSPTQKIDYSIVNNLNKFTHEIPMRSLAKTKSVEEIDNFFGDKEKIAMLKMDGLSLSLTYKNGVLVSAATRGNGEVGEDVTHNAQVIANIPSKIPCDVELVVNGEIICPIDVFEKYFAEVYKNARNFAAGSIRLLNSKECDQRKLKFIAWDCVKGLAMPEFTSRLEFLQTIGFDVVPWMPPIFLNTQFAIDSLKISANINNLPIDGIVFRFNNIAYGESLGSTAHHPNHSIAFKFMDETVETHLIDIEYEPSRNGVLTPIAIFEPVELEGSVVSRASVHNITVMKELFHGTPWRGQSIETFKSNMIIPQIKSAEYYADSECDFIELPTTCPDCGEALRIVKSETGVETLICPNEKCNCRLINQLDHFCGKSGLDIKGLSKATLEKLIDWGWVSNKKDIFYLNQYRTEWIKKPGFGVKSVDKILTAIDSARHTTFANFIVALGIPLVGSSIAKLLEKYEKTYESFREHVKAPFGVFSVIEGIGTEIEYSIKRFDYTEADEIYKELKIGFTESDETKFTTFEGQKFAITGKLSIGRERMSELIEKHGGTITSSVSRKTDYLIANQPEDSAKYKNAIAYDTKIITENELLKILDF